MIAPDKILKDVETIKKILELSMEGITKSKIFDELDLPSNEFWAYINYCIERGLIWQIQEIHGTEYHLLTKGESLLDLLKDMKVLLKEV